MPKITAPATSGRPAFKSQALLDETALITAMAYVDLNPIRAKMADPIEHSDFTSAQDRWRNATSPGKPSVATQRPRLRPFIEAEHQRSPDHLPFILNDYLALIEATGRIPVAGKRGFIPEDRPKLLNSLNVNQQQWIETVIHLNDRFELAVGTPEKMMKLAHRWGKRWIHGITHARKLYPASSG